MHIAISSDAYDPLMELLFEEVKKRGHTFIYFGPKKVGEEKDWPEITLRAMEEIHHKRADEGIVVCWTGTGCSIIANKVKGIRAALCLDSETARGARIWNHANVLALSLRLTSPALLKEILAAWFDTPFSEDPWNRSQIQRVKEYEAFPFPI